MTCTVNHLLIERGVKLRELGHFIMEGRDNMEKCMICDLPAPDNDDWHSHHEELDRLRTVNAKLLETLEDVIQHAHYDLHPEDRDAELKGELFADEYELACIAVERLDRAREAIEKARK